MDIETLMEALAQDCRDRLQAQESTAPEGYCSGEFDSVSCWPYAAPGSYVQVPCPTEITRNATRYCEPDGEWRMREDKNKTWVDYASCNMSAEILLKNDTTVSTEERKMFLLTNVGYSFSFVTLFLAMGVFIYFKRLHCTRNYIHMHLFASFFLRATMIFVKGSVVLNATGIREIDGTDFRSSGGGTSVAPSSWSPEASGATSIEQLVKAQQSTSTVTCKAVVTVYHYFMATNYFWIVVEGLYLHCLIFVTFFAERKYLLRFTLIGWGLPLLFVIPWAISKEFASPASCWRQDDKLRWIYDGPIIAANVVNFFLFVNIVRVLWYKMRYSVCSQPEIGNQYRKLAKSTLVLIPMFGVHVIIFRGLPDTLSSTSWLWKVRMYWELFFDSFQGFFVAIIYCFINGEVLAELKRTWSLFQTTFQIQRNQRQSSRTANTIIANFSSTATPVAPRPSISISPFNNRGYSQADEQENSRDLLLKKTSSEMESRDETEESGVLGQSVQQETDLVKTSIVEIEPLLERRNYFCEKTTSADDAADEENDENASERREDKTTTFDDDDDDDDSLISPVSATATTTNIASSSSSSGGGGASKGRRASEDSGINSLFAASASAAASKRRSATGSGEVTSCGERTIESV